MLKSVGRHPSWKPLKNNPRVVDPRTICHMCVLFTFPTWILSDPRGILPNQRGLCWFHVKSCGFCWNYVGCKHVGFVETMWVANMWVLLKSTRKHVENLKTRIHTCGRRRNPHGECQDPHGFRCGIFSAGILYVTNWTLFYYALPTFLWREVSGPLRGQSV